MAILGKLSPTTAETDTLLYRVPANRRAVLNLAATNRSGALARIRVALVAADDLIVDSVTVTNPGSGYTTIPTLTLTPPAGNTPTTAATLSVASMQVASVSLLSAGAGYLVGDILEIQGGTASTRARVRVEAIGAGGTITTLSLFEVGTYTGLPSGTLSLNGGTGSGATLTASFGIRAISVGNKGQGYTGTPTLSAPGGTGFAATLNLSQAIEGNDYLEFDASLDIADVLERTGLALSAGDGLFVRSNTANSVNFFAIGFEEVA